MKNLALLFPGQGSQYVGMAKSFSDATPFRLAKMVLGLDLQKIMFDGPEEDLKLTAHTQPAIVLHSWLIYEKLFSFLETKEIKPQMCLGHSVGEYSALAAAKAIPWAQAVKAVHLRGKYMQEATPIGMGKMIAFLKAPLKELEDACKFVSKKTGKVVAPANYNSLEQIVISGDKEACDQVVEYLKTIPGIKFRSVDLPVSAPFHCALMNPAAKKMEEALSQFTISPSDLPYVANIDATLYPENTAPEKIKHNLLAQIPGAVRWMQSVEKIPPGTLCLEVGPGKVLSNLVSKQRSDLQVFNLDREDAFEELEKLLHS